MVFTVRYILGCLLVLLSCTTIHSLSLRYIREAPPEVNLNISSQHEINIDQQVKADGIPIVTDQPKTEELSTTRIPSRGTVKYITTVATTTPTATEDTKSQHEKERTENARSLDFDISKYISPEFHSKNNVYNQPTSPENEKYINPDLEPKTTTNYPKFMYNTELTTPTSQYFDARYQEVVQQNLADLEHRLANNFTTPTLEELIDKSKNNSTKTNLDILRYTNVINDNKKEKNNIQKNYENVQGLQVNFDSIYNDTKIIDEGVNVIKRPLTTETSRLDNQIKTSEAKTNFPTTTRRIHPTKALIYNRTREQNPLISNKIETEQSKPLDLGITNPIAVYNGSNINLEKIDPVVNERTTNNAINVHKRGSTKYIDNFSGTTTERYSSKYTSKLPLTVQNLGYKQNETGEQSVQENNIYPVIVPASTEEMYEITDTKTEYSTTIEENTTESPSTTVKEEFYEMTVEHTTTSTIVDTTTEELTTNTPKLTTNFLTTEESIYSTTDETLATTEISTVNSDNLTTTDSKVLQNYTGYKNESNNENNLTSTETNFSEESTIENNLFTPEINISTTEKVLSITEKILSTSENNIAMTENNVSTTENNVSATDITTTESYIFTTESGISTTNKYNNLIQKKSMTEDNVSSTENMFPTVTTEIYFTTENNAITVENNTTSNEIKDISFSDAPDATTEINQISSEKESTSTTDSISFEYYDAMVTTNADSTTVPNEKQIDVKENDIAKENNTKTNSTEMPLMNSEVDEDNDDLDEMDYIEMHGKKVNQTNKEEIEIIHIEPEHTTLPPNVKKSNPNTYVTTTMMPPEEGTTEEIKFEPDEESNSGTIIAIVLSTVGAICLIVLAILLFVMRTRQKRFNYGQRCTPVSLDAYSMDNVSVYNSVRRKAAMRGSKRSYGNPAFDDISVSHPLNFQSLSRFANNTEEINTEFEEIPQVTARMNELPEGCDTKNRYANVIPLPETRVFLSSVDSDPTSDYINANYVTGPKGARNYYIACQAPLQGTINDFWRMVWEQQSKVILMLTHFYESGVEKCVDYLPPSEVLDCHRLFGDYQVTLKKREVKDKYIISSLQLKNMVSNSWREVTHIWYSGWPEKGVPDEENSIIAFLIEARSFVKLVQNNVEVKRKENGIATNPEATPVVVHCSPGTGRTGTVIACDIAIREFELKRVVDVPKIVYRIRRDRASAVQTKDQYAYIYRVINLYATKLTGGALDSI